jgi:hypothetical protein
VPRAAARQLAAVAAQEAGILPLIRGAHTALIFPPDSALGRDAEGVLERLQATPLDDGWGHFGADLVPGRGRGADGDARTIGVGRLPTVGECAGCRDGHGARYAAGAPVARLRHDPRAPEVVPGAVELRCGRGDRSGGGCLDKEIVRRVVRQHRNEVRFCYERALAARPTLSGRVLTQFMIADSGRVLMSRVAESSLADGDVAECIAAAVRRWEFPASAQALLVSYPFVLTPSP